MTPGERIPLDVMILGGGVAGLWLLDELTGLGYRALLLEAHALGSGQTIASQGIIHGGLKYSLKGLIPGSARAIKDMPIIWKQCLSGKRRPNLSATRLRSDHCYLWQTESLVSRVGMMGAKSLLRVKPIAVSRGDLPGPLESCPGNVYRLDEQVIDPASMIENLADQHRNRLLHVPAPEEAEWVLDGPGRVNAIRLRPPETGKDHADSRPIELRPKQMVLTAGKGNRSLHKILGLSTTVIQLRPLHMLMVRKNSDKALPQFNGHCIDGNRTRVTITSGVDSAGRTVWQVGGQLAEDGMAMTPRELATHGKHELEAVLPGIDLDNTQWATYQVDRAEGATQSGAKPDDPVLIQEGNVITAWPTKLALAPKLSQQIVQCLEPPSHDAVIDPPVPVDWPRPGVAKPPWETDRPWFDNV